VSRVRRGAPNAPSSRASANENSRRARGPTRLRSSARRTGFSCRHRDEHAVTSAAHRLGSRGRDVAGSTSTRTHRRASDRRRTRSSPSAPEVDRPHNPRANDRTTKICPRRLSDREAYTRSHSGNIIRRVDARGTVSARSQPARSAMSQSTVNEVRRAPASRAVRPADGRLPGQSSEALRTGHTPACTRELNSARKRRSRASQALVWTAGARPRCSMMSVTSRAAAACASPKPSGPTIGSASSSVHGAPNPNIAVRCVVTTPFCPA
jgi:hypothetical protein